ncbi:unnamed protein product [Schistosoma margrebowiei]|uniref:Uncharacterized protein n=1 Tax=Schistosoma margrebowiei TaxID=48269 RepID=A0A183NAM3_9TREM|nr:unnamed protein product [Schistosoma margrebowiei]
MQIKTASVAAVSASVGLSIHKGKTKVLIHNTESSNPITLDGETLEDVSSFTYLGSIIDEQGGSDAEIKARIGKARVVFLQLKDICNSKELSTNIKVRIFNTNVKTVLLYGAETSRTTTTNIKSLLIVVYEGYSTSIGRIPSATASSGRDQTSFQLKRKLGNDDRYG